MTKSCHSRLNVEVRTFVAYQLNVLDCLGHANFNQRHLVPDLLKSTPLLYIAPSSDGPDRLEEDELDLI
jgi:hypothetical protein